MGGRANIKEQLEHVAETKAWVKSKINVLDREKVKCGGFDGELESPMEVDLIAATILAYFGDPNPSYFVLGACEKRVNGDSCDGLGKCIYSQNNKPLMKDCFPDLTFGHSGPLNSSYFYYLETKSLMGSKVKEPFWKGLVD